VLHDDNLTLVCPKCSRKTLAAESGSQTTITCRDCAFTALRSDLMHTAQEKAIKDVDDALSRVREMNRRFPNR
jgi:hypothetical protein